MMVVGCLLQHSDYALNLFANLGTHTVCLITNFIVFPRKGINQWWYSFYPALLTFSLSTSHLFTHPFQQTAFGVFQG